MECPELTGSMPMTPSPVTMNMDMYLGKGGGRKGGKDSLVHGRL